jgi:hypothetical protein
VAGESDDNRSEAQGGSREASLKAQSRYLDPIIKPNCRI